MKAFYCDCGNNWGDNFTKYLLEKKFRLRIECFEPHEGDPGTAELFGIGSTLEYVPTGYTGTILGTGLMFAESRKDLRSANVLALRGKHTLERCHVSRKPVLGDLGLFADLFAPDHRPKEYIHGIIPHYVDRDHPEMVKWSRRDDTLVIDIRAGIKPVILQAASCAKIVSSSLHGLVIADALGIPNQWIKLSDKLSGGEFKFIDYYSVYGEFPWPQTDVQQALAEVRSRDVSAVKTQLRDTLDAYASTVLKNLR